jgi:translation initiation factor IF-3
LRKPRFIRRQFKRKVRHRVNEGIRIPEVRVIGPDGSQIGVMNTRDALEKAYSMGLDLVEVSASSRPPVCKILDYGKFKYDLKKKQRESKKTHSGEVKEISFRPNIDEHDLETKMKKMIEFLESGRKVRLRVFFRGREIVRQDRGRKLLNQIIQDHADICTVEMPARMEGRNLITMVKPISGKGRSRDAKGEDQEVSGKEIREDRNRKDPEKAGESEPQALQEDKQEKKSSEG